MDSSRREVELEEQLKEAANLLFTPSSDVDELNNILDVSSIFPFLLGFLIYLFIWLYMIICIMFSIKDLLFGQMGLIVVCGTMLICMCDRMGFPLPVELLLLQIENWEQ